MEERDWKGGRGQMRNRKKALTRKGKIMAALAVVITFVFVLAWHQMRNAQAYGTYDTGGNKHFVDGHLTVTINGPDGKSDSLTMYVHSDDYKKIKMSVVQHLKKASIHIRYRIIPVDTEVIVFR